MSVTFDCIVPVQAGFKAQCKAVFNTAGCLLVIEGMELGAEIPESFVVDLEGHLISVCLENGEHYVIPDDRDAFVAMVFG
jgi:hypothetical protein